MGRVDRDIEPFPARRVTQALDEFELPMAVIDLDDLRILAVSDVVLTRLGLPPEEVVGRSIVELLSPGDAARAHVALEAIGSGAVDFYRAHRALRASKEASGLDTQWVRAIELGGRRVALVEASESGDVMSPLVRHLGIEPVPIALGTASRSWVVDAVSDELVDVLGMTPDEMIQRPLTGMVHADDLERFLDADRRARDGVSVGISLRMRDVHGEWAPTCVLITSLATTDSRSFMLFAEIVAPPSETGRVAQLEHHLWRIAAEIQGSGVLERLGTLPDPLPHPQLARLTPRQLEVLSRLARGQRVATIAQELFITESTVRNHLSVIFDRFGVRSQTELLELLSEGAV